MNIVQNIEHFKHQLSATDLKLANFILDNTEEIPTMTSNEIADSSQTSPSTVVRFAKKLGYNKFSDFKIALSKDIEKRVYNEYNSVSFDESFQTSKNKLIHNDQLIIESIANIVEEKVINQTINLLLSKNKIYVYGVGSSSLIAEDIRQKWTKLGKTVIFDKDTFVLRQQMSNDVHSALFFGISHSGKNREVLSLMNCAKENNLLTLSLTQLGQTDVAKISDVVIQTPRTDYIDNGHYGSGATHSILLQFATIDLLYFFYIKKLKEIDFLSVAK